MATASDNFNRANENPIAGNWETITSAGVRLNTNQCDSPAADDVNRISGWKSSTNSFGADQYSEIAFNAIGGLDFGGAGVRCTTTGGGQGYIVLWVNTNTVRVYKVSAGANTQIGSTIASTPVAGDVLRITSTTNGANCDLKVYLNGAQIGSTITDSTSPYTSGQPAIAILSSNTNTTKIDNWAGGDLSTGITTKVMSETITLADTALDVVYRVRRMDETIVLIDAALDVLRFVRVQVDGITLNDGNTFRTSIITATDTLDIIDAFSKTLTGNGIVYAKVMSDTITLIDNTGQRWTLRSTRLTDAVGLSDSVLDVLRLVRQLNETVEFSDGVVKIGRYVRVMQDQLEIPDEMIKLLGLAQFYNVTFNFGHTDPIRFGGT